jgi:hypothetical protein
VRAAVARGVARDGQPHQHLPDLALPRLRELHLRNNALQTLPGSIAELRELPAALLDLPRLEKLDLRWVDGRFDVADGLERRGCLVYR